MGTLQLTSSSSFTLFRQKHPTTITTKLSFSPSHLNNAGLLPSHLPKTIRIGTRRTRVVEEESQDSSEPAETELASELKKAMQERKEKQEDNLLNGVAQEIAEIEWPAFGKVLGTTGVVLGVIFGSSVVLLTVNAVLAELSDRFFAGKGIQDFFT